MDSETVAVRVGSEENTANGSFMHVRDINTLTCEPLAHREQILDFLQR
jgi:hypothetical protein